jgi:hypothetical protein
MQFVLDALDFFHRDLVYIPLLFFIHVFANRISRWGVSQWVRDLTVRQDRGTSAHDAMTFSRTTSFIPHHHYNLNTTMSDAPTIFTKTSAFSLAGVLAVGLIAYVGSKLFLPKNARWQDRYTFIWLVSSLFKFTMQPPHPWRTCIVPTILPWGVTYTLIYRLSTRSSISCSKAPSYGSPSWVGR